MAQNYFLSAFAIDSVPEQCRFSYLEKSSVAARLFTMTLSFMDVHILFGAANTYHFIVKIRKEFGWLTKIGSIRNFLLCNMQNKIVLTFAPGREPEREYCPPVVSIFSVQFAFNSNFLNVLSLVLWSYLKALRSGFLLLLLLFLTT